MITLENTVGDAERRREVNVRNLAHAMLVDAGDAGLVAADIAARLRVSLGEAQRALRSLETSGFALRDPRRRWRGGVRGHVWTARRVAA